MFELFLEDCDLLEEIEIQEELTTEQTAAYQIAMFKFDESKLNDKEYMNSVINKFNKVASTGEDALKVCSAISKIIAIMQAASGNIFIAGYAMALGEICTSKLYKKLIKSDREKIGKKLISLYDKNINDLQKQMNNANKNEKIKIENTIKELKNNKENMKNKLKEG